MEPSLISEGNQPRTGVLELSDAASMEPSLISEGNEQDGGPGASGPRASMEPSLISEGNSTSSRYSSALVALQWSPR